MSCDIRLKEKGLKFTPQRRLILDIIHNAHSSLCGEEIVSHVQSRMPGVHKSTIYRTLELLESLGCVFKSELGEKTIYHHTDEGHHHHLVCSQCGKTIDCEDALFQSIEKSLDENYGFQVDFKHTVMSGLCLECRKTAKV